MAVARRRRWRATTSASPSLRTFTVIIEVSARSPAASARRRAARRFDPP
jgi:hypothetical protein